MPKTATLSKSRLTLGLQCKKALYLKIHKPELAEEISAATQKNFDQGHEVGVEAQKQYPNGTLIDAPYYSPEKAIEQTTAAIKANASTIYEATFLHDDVVVKIDILHRANPKHAWRIIEVKSSTSVKEQYIPDAAIQYWVAKGAGIKIESVSIMHINNTCIYPKLDQLFTTVDITDEVQPLQKSLPKLVTDMKQMLAAKKHPALDIGEHCDSPYECAFKDHCWSHIPSPSIFDIPSLGQKAWQLYEKKILKLNDVDLKMKIGPRGFTENQKRMITHTISKKRFIDTKQILKEYGLWEYPLAVLDFETIAYAIPRFKGTKPYQLLPFQFSCHIISKPGAKLTHVEYLHMEPTDPRQAIADALVKLIPKAGSVVAYNKGFESRVLKELAQEFPKLSRQLIAIADRLVDPLPLFRAHVYDHAFLGSFSLKAVAPAILGTKASYSDLEVGDGTEAQSAYVDLMASDTTPERKKELYESLLQYCRQDTRVVVDLIEWLHGLAS